MIMDEGNTSDGGPRGLKRLRDPLLNKGTAFTMEERDALGLRGMLPPYVSTLDEQVAERDGEEVEEAVVAGSHDQKLKHDEPDGTHEAKQAREKDAKREHQFDDEHREGGGLE